MSTGRRRRKKRRALRLLVRGVILIAAVVALLLLFQRPILRRFVLPRIEQPLGSALGLDVSLGDIFVMPTGTATVDGFRATGPTPSTGIRAASFSKGVVRFSLLKLLRGRDDWIESIRVEDPRLELDLSHDPVFPEQGERAPPPTPGKPVVLPRIELRNAEIRLLTDVDDLELHGVDAELVARRIHLAVASADGRWSPPRIEALKFPLEVDVELAGSPAEPWSDIRIGRLSMAGREQVRDLRVDLTDPRAVRFAGDLPGWRMTLTSGSVATPVGEPPLLDLSFLAAGADLKPIVSLFTDWPGPDAECRGSFRLILPIGREADWRAETDMELSGVVWNEQALSADAVRFAGRRDDGLVLSGELLATRLAWRGIPAVDLTGKFRRQSDGGAGQDSSIALDGIVLRRGDVEAEVSGLLHERALRVEHASLRATRVPVAELSRLGALPSGLESSDAELDIEASGAGALSDPATWDAVAKLRGRAMWVDFGDPEASLALDAKLGACQLGVGDAIVRRCEDEVRFALEASVIDLPVIVSVERIEGSVLGVALAVVEPPAIEVGGDGFRVEPFSLLALGGTVGAAASGNASGELSAFVSLGADLAVFRAVAPELAPSGALSAFASLRAGDVRAADGLAIEMEASVRGGGLTVAGERLEKLEGALQAKLTGSSLDVTRLEVSRAADRVSVSGSVPVTWDPLPLPRSGGELSGNFVAELADASSLPGTKSLFRDLGGRIRATGSVAGKVADSPREALRALDFSALVRVDGGRIKRYDETPPISELDGEIRFANGTITLAGVTGKVYDAPFGVTGRIDLDRASTEEGRGIRDIDLTLHSKSALLVRRPNLRVRGDLDLRWHGPWGASALDGSVVITRAYYLEDISLAPTRGARLPLKLFSLKDAPFDAMQFDVKIGSDRGITVRNNMVSTRASAQLVLGGTGLEPVLSGTISTDEGTVRFADSALKLRNSYIELLANDPLNPRLQIVIGETIRGYAVTLSITGTLEQPEVLLDSSPPLEREKVLVLITTGLTLEEIEDRGVSRVAAVKAAKYVGLRLARYLSRGDPTDKSFFDRISLETESAKAVGYEDPIRVEIRIIEGLIRESDEFFLQGERDQYGDYNFNFGLRFELDPTIDMDRLAPALLIGLLSLAAARGEEAPSVYDVTFELTGNESISSGSLRDALSALHADVRRSGVDQGAAEDAAYELVRHYHSKGFRRAEVGATWTRDGMRFTVTLRIVEGPRSILRGVEFDGNAFFTTPDLEECFPWLRSGILGLGETVFTEGVLADGVDCIVTRYQLDGFLFAEVVPAVSENDAGDVRVRLEVREGPRMYLTVPPAFEGLSAISADQLIKTFQLDAHPPYTPRMGLLLKGRILDHYRRRGYLFATVDVVRDVDRDAATARLTFRVKEGPRVRIEEVRISGNEITHEWVLRDRIRLEKGDLYDDERVRESYRSLLRAGLFSSVSIEPHRVEGSEDRVYLDVSVKEKARYKLSLLAGYGTYELVRGGIVLEDANLFGAGHRLRLEGKGSLRGESASISYVNPFFFKEDLSHLAQGSYERRENPSFEQRDYGGESGVSWKVSDVLRSSLTYRLKQSDVIDADSGVPPELIEDVFISSILSSTIFDARDSIVDPGHGFTTRATIEYAGGPLGSEIDFLKVTAFASYIVPLPMGLRLVAAARAGVIDRLADTEVIPIQERFFNGGEYTIRSFPRDEAGPKSNGDPIGGETFTTTNLELRFPIVFLDGLTGSFFFDSGTLTEEIQDFGGGRYFFALGVGVRYNTPVGPFRLDVGFNPDREHGEDLAVFNFGVGYPF